MSQIPIGWLIFIEGFEETPLTTGFYDDRWYTKPAPLLIIINHNHHWGKPIYLYIYIYIYIYTYHISYIINHH